MPEAKLVFAGEAQMEIDLTGNDGVIITGFLSDADYRAWLAAADAGLQLRLGQPGGVSAALQDCIGTGLPCVASRDLAVNINAPDYVKRVADKPDLEEISLALEKTLLEARDTETARADYVAAHAMAAYAERLLEIVLA
ncbi:MAG: hypothetical protein KGL65_05710, partial [Rhodospirillales bacterium]|nr:hypothetical protein [Rhodospirillales bacterium]